jgi:hypothetical protein
MDMGCHTPSIFLGCISIWVSGLFWYAVGAGIHKNLGSKFCMQVKRKYIHHNYKEGTLSQQVLLNIHHQINTFICVKVGRVLD